MYKPRSTREIYTESLSVNSTSLKRHLEDKAVPEREIRIIMETVGKRYQENVDAIVEECDKDMMALERVPSPLRLFVDCIAEAKRTLDLSHDTQSLLHQYTAAWEDWME